MINRKQIFIINWLLLTSFFIVLILPVFLNSVFANNDCQTKQECEALLKKYEEDIKKLEGAVAQTEQEKQTIQGQINNLRSSIQKIDAQIQQGNVMIRDLSFQIKDTEQSIESTSYKIEDSRVKLADILQTIYQEDQTSLIEILLTGETLSYFFDNLTSLETLNLKGYQLLEEIKILKSTLENQKQTLDVEKGDTERIVKVQTLQKQQSQAARNEQEYFLSLKKAEQEQYLREKQQAEKQAAEIRARIFELAGMPADVKAPTFGEAYEIAKRVESLTGVRPAFLLAVLQQESAIGRNVGQCYLPRDTNEILRIRAMAMPPISSRNDVAHFLQITRELGLDPYTTPISCPMSFGWGGAMGPAQFIPTTWMGYKTRLEGLLGRRASPWNVFDAFLASGLYLSDYGAGAKTRNAEWCAAQGYFTGTKCSTRHSFYGDNVLATADRFQRDIDILEANK
jgi:membrane-bound lytic murein transglycosylase B/uncharacterized protein YoxC